jgi:hypothetical protein
MGRPAAQRLYGASPDRTRSGPEFTFDSTDRRRSSVVIPMTSGSRAISCGAEGRFQPLEALTG